LQKEICNFAKNDNWILNSDYHFGGYAKVTDELIDFINDFYQSTGIPLDPIYTGKMVYGVLDLIKNNYFHKDAKILMIHTGGLQGIEGMNKVLISKGKKTLQIDV
jgi:1-aminocyclopropane-1-carboxylate deaminase